MAFKHGSVCVCVLVCVVLNTLPNIITTYQGHFPLSGLAVPAGVDWEKIRAYSLDYKKCCKQCHVGATERRQRAASVKETQDFLGWLSGAWLRGQRLTILLVGLLGRCLAVWLSSLHYIPLARFARH